MYSHLSVSVFHIFFLPVLNSPWGIPLWKILAKIFQQNSINHGNKIIDCWCSLWHCFLGPYPTLLLLSPKDYFGVIIKGTCIDAQTWISLFLHIHAQICISLFLHIELWYTPRSQKGGCNLPPYCFSLSLFLFHGCSKQFQVHTWESILDARNISRCARRCTPTVPPNGTPRRCK